MATIRKKGNSYEITVSNGYDITGKQIRTYITYTPDKTKTPKQQAKEVEKYAYEFEQAVINGEVLDGRYITLEMFYYKWLSEYASIALEKTSVEWYRRMFETKILPAIGHLKLASIKTLHIQTFYNSLLKEGAKKDGGAYSPTSIKRFHSCVRAVLNKAVEWELIKSNPALKTSLPKQKTVCDSVKCFTPEQAAAFLNCLNKYTSAQFNALFNIAIYGGLRRGEILGLTWEDIDFEKKTLNINKSVAVVNGKVTVKSTKNKSSERIITVPNSVMGIIRFWKIEQMKLRLTLHNKWEGDNFVFIQWNGKLMHPSTPYYTLKSIINKYNKTGEHPELPDIRFHDLRHTSATLLISSNTDIKTVSARLGHAQTSTTMNIYAHSIRKLDEVASDNLEKILSYEYKAK